MKDLYDYQRALYLALMMIASADKEFDERENEVLFDIVAQVLPNPQERKRFIVQMSRELEEGKYKRNFMTVDFFRKQARMLARLNGSSRRRILDMARRLVDADGMDTHRERFLFEELRQALEQNNSDEKG